MSLFSHEKYDGYRIQNSVLIEVPLTATSVSSTVFIAPTDYQVLNAKISFATASTSGTVNLEVLNAGAAKGTGTLVYATALPLSGTANTPVSTVAPQKNYIPSNRRVATVIAGTLTGLVDGLLQIELVKV